MSNQTNQPPTTATVGQDEKLHGSLASTLTYSFTSPGPFGDWLRFFVIGGILELSRRFLMYVWSGLVNQFWITIALDEYSDSYCESGLSSCYLATSLMNDDSVAWVMLWLSKQPAWTQAKELSISSHSFGVGAPAVLVEGEPDDSSQRMIRFLPSQDYPASVWYRGHYIRFSRNPVPDGSFYGNEILTIKLVIPRSPYFLPIVLILGY